MPTERLTARPELVALAARLGQEQARDGFDALVDHIAELARRQVAATGCAFPAACDVVIDLLIDSEAIR